MSKHLFAPADMPFDQVMFVKKTTDGNELGCALPVEASDEHVLSAFRALVTTCQSKKEKSPLDESASVT